MPLAAYATLQGEQLTIQAIWGDPEGRMALVHAQASALVQDVDAATRLGEQVAVSLKAAMVRAGASAPTETSTH